ncbi:helix-turn-helix domain-containing protein [Geobacter sp. FeAm09]|uniref:helix-turn-helix domain-containing protein n=1 Tax=Geobacter sp. FeAm09 TaxID=2597769 RepID=UPI0011EFA31D|nr:helix-turn-helix domain-containing protein [Geobacter sp. FeAm09]QEM68915.1 helix-turn-helix domain-containing protein [Geobacter sp. FeAm09]
MPEMLTVEQFSQRLQVSRATVFVWIQKNILCQGKHYFKIGRVLRILWTKELLESLSQAPGHATRELESAPRQKKSSGPLNWDY